MQSVKDFEQEYDLIYARRANILDVAQCPVHNCNLDEASPNYRNNLAHKGNTGWDLHIMANLKRKTD
jgi:hypothetical protein